MYRAHESKQGNYELLYWEQFNIVTTDVFAYQCNQFKNNKKFTMQAMPTLTRQITSYNNIVLQNMAMPAC